MPRETERIVFHVVRVEDLVWDGDLYRAASLATEGFIHASFRDRVAESARLYFPTNATLSVLEIDTSGLDVRVVETPRGPMPHIHEPLPRASVRRIMKLDEL